MAEKRKRRKVRKRGSNMPMHRRKKRNGAKKGGMKPCLTAKQKKLPKPLQAAIRKKNRPCK